MWKFHFWIVDRAILKNLSLSGGGGRLEGYLKSVKEQNEKTGNLTLTWGGGEGGRVLTLTPVIKNTWSRDAGGGKDGIIFSKS